MIQRLRRTSVCIVRNVRIAAVKLILREWRTYNPPCNLEATSRESLFSELEHM